MAFWSRSDFKEPLRANKWYIEFTGILKDVRFALKECKKPSYKISETKHRCFNYVVNLPGTLTWDPINIKFASVRGQSTSKDSSVLLYNVLKNGGSQTPKTFLETTLSKTRMHNALETGLLNIIQVDSEGKPVEVWSLYNAYISVANFGSLSYDNENIVDIDCTITYDWAELNNQERATRLGISTTDPVPPELPASEQQPDIEPPPPPTPEQPPPESDAAPAGEQATPEQSPQDQPAAQQPTAEQPIVSAEGIIDPMAEAEIQPEPLVSSDNVNDPMKATSTPERTSSEADSSSANQPSKQEIDAAIAEAKDLIRQSRDATKAREDAVRNQKLLEDARENEDIVSTKVVSTLYDSDSGDITVKEKITYSNNISEDITRKANANEAKTFADQLEAIAKKTYSDAISDEKITSLENATILMNRSLSTQVRNKANEYAGDSSRVEVNRDLRTEDVYEKN